MKVIIMAGGKGTRIASVKSDVPKPMIPIAGKPILEWQIECLRSQGLKEITLVIGFLGHVIQEYFGDGSRFGVKIDRQHLDDTEELTVHLMTKEEVKRLLDGNEIIQSLMVAPLLRYFMGKF